MLFLSSQELNFPRPNYEPACHSTSSENESWFTSWYPRRLALLVGSLLLICLASPADGQGGFGNFIQNLFRPIMRWKITVRALFFAKITEFLVTWMVMVVDQYQGSYPPKIIIFCDADPSTTSFVRSALAFAIFSALGHKQMRLSGEDFDICIWQAVNMKHIWVEPNF